MNIWHDISPERIKAERFISVIEIPSGSKNKYELDKETGFFIHQLTIQLTMDLFQELMLKIMTH